ncbi:hypothetical protein [Streptomyces sp. UNOC14_S4]|uniref:hypothetical protein n=1 Tax=Streptomyces sp. UNOC14_S4 TaxID=2872340 RepID=UPI001E32FDA2|nr:hypothetical protein [Streptomyces sp. UNOC14_S4]MCC3767489.1 hypothetical protein [Streptomyces sp. UNOC14_S4]
MDGKGDSEAKPKKKGLELSLAQVAGSALAAVVAALLAGKLGVYGTVLGAGVVSVVATSGGTIFQHLFRRTGEQLREATTQAAKPKLRQVPVRDAGRAVRRLQDGHPDTVGTQLLPQAGQGHGADATQVLRGAGPLDATQALPAEDATQLLHGAGHAPGQSAPYAGAYGAPHAGPYGDQHNVGFSAEYTPGETQGTRLRGWKRPVLAAAAVFALAMGTVTAVEMFVLGGTSNGEKGTSVSQIFTGGGGKSDDKQDKKPSHTPTPGQSQDGGREHGQGGTGGATPDPDASHQGGGGKQSPDPSTSPGTGGTTGGPSPKPNPSNPVVPTPDGGKGGTSTGQGNGGTTSGQGSSGGQGDSKPPQGQNAAAAGTP